MKKIEIGDYIVFKAATRSHFRKARRRVNGFWHTGEPTVGYHGYSNFIVRRSEILDVEKSPPSRQAASPPGARRAHSPSP